MCAGGGSGAAIYGSSVTPRDPLVERPDHIALSLPEVTAVLEVLDQAEATARTGGARTSAGRRRRSQTEIIEAFVMGEEPPRREQLDLGSPKTAAPRRVSSMGRRWPPARWQFSHCQSSRRAGGSYRS
jgi:hypothetical protein